MCSVMTATTILEILEEKIQNGEVFTAFDITEAARAKTDDTVIHGEVRDIVNNEYITGHVTGKPISGYDRELSVLNLAGNPQALVYFPDSMSASDHPLVSDSTVSDNTDDGTDDGTVDDLGDDEYNLTKEGRIQIPRKLLSQVSPNAGSYDLLISGTLKCAPADARGDVRVCLRQMGISGTKVKLTVDSTNNTINLETV